jgi:V8-like Glu-specific endopeptidase
MMKRSFLTVAVLSVALTSLVAWSQEESGKVEKTDSSKREVEHEDKSVSADPAIVKAINQFAKSASDGDAELEMRLKLDAIRTIRKARSEKKRRARLEAKRADLLKELGETNEQLNRIGKSSTGLVPVADHTIESQQKPGSKTGSLQRFVKPGFAPRMMRPNSRPVMQASRLFKNPVWQANMSDLIELGGCSVAPRIYNPIDNENNPTTDVLDCVSIGRPGQSCCTGTLIAPNAVLTAAHCVDTPGEPGCGATHIYVGWNANNPSQDRLFQIRANGENPHPDYNSALFYNDLAILILEKPVPASMARPRALAYTSEIKGASSFLAMGFGHTDQGQYGIKYESPVALAGLTTYEIEAGGNGFDTCQGDSGGPLFYVGQFGANKGRLFLAGVTSHGGACGQGGVYTRVDVYKDWINGVLRQYGSETR